jgi:outer membrane protein assembly factor BamB
MRRIFTVCMVTSLIVSASAADEWSQFRGPNSSGHAGIQDAVPVEFGPEQNVLWKCKVTRGVSSPCILGNRIFLTSFDKTKSELQVTGIKRDKGTIAWQVSVRTDAVEKVHKASSPANATVVADDQHIYVYFASCGIFCFDHEGNAVWEHRMPVSNRFNGSGTSPTLAGDRIILNREDTQARYLIALSAESGEQLWRTPHVGGGQSFGEATPLIWNDQVVLHRHNEVAAFGLNDGKRRWSAPLSTTAASTPVIHDDTLYVAAWNNFGEADLAGKLPEFALMLKQHDKDSDGNLSSKEVPWGPTLAQRPELAGRRLGGNMPVKFMFGAIDTNRDGKVDKSEWSKASDVVRKGVEHGLTAIHLTRQAGQVQTKTLWSINKSVPEVPSPLVVGDNVYMIKNGGILTCINRTSGTENYRTRLKAPGPYFASPITVNGHVIAASGDGVVTVFKAGDDFELSARNDLKEEVMATPAISDGVLYLRTASTLYAFTKP